MDNNTVTGRYHDVLYSSSIMYSSVLLYLQVLSLRGVPYVVAGLNFLIPGVEFYVTQYKG